VKDILRSWNDLSLPWRVFVAALPLLLILFLVLLGGEVPMAILSAIVWAAAAASIVRAYVRLRDRRP
jgi:hypothetical protein